jgi:hypothetical protein
VERLEDCCSRAAEAGSRKGLEARWQMSGLCQCIEWLSALDERRSWVKTAISGVAACWRKVRVAVHMS